MAEEKYHLEIESDPNNLITVEEFVNYFCKDVNLPDEKLANVLLAVTEATTNAIIHANKCDTNKKVTIDASVENSKLIIKIKDEGEGFDPGNIPDPTDPENLLKDSGRGIYLMRVYMDDLQYNRTPSGMEFVLTVKL
ncbi:MAG: ATP-binding protein [Bacteroidetes bacterium]|nr:ATP-binding protein [Bacteroidota bacterium]